MKKMQVLALSSLLVASSIVFANEGDKSEKSKKETPVTTMSFGVISQRSAAVTTEYWTPILQYVSKKSGVPLELQMAPGAGEHAKMISKGAYDFIYSNHNFVPKNALQGYSVIARPIDDTIQSNIIVLDSSPYQSLKDLQGQDVAFPSKVAFVGYVVPSYGLQKEKVTVQPVFAGNQENTIGLLLAGRVAGAAVNSNLLTTFAARQNLKYRVIWKSEDFLNLPISVHPRVSPTKVKAVQKAFIEMANDNEGKEILEKVAQIIKQKPPYGFLLSNDAEYQSQKEIYKNTKLEEDK